MVCFSCNELDKFEVKNSELKFNGVSPVSKPIGRKRKRSSSDSAEEKLLVEDPLKKRHVSSEQCSPTGSPIANNVDAEFPAKKRLTVTWAKELYDVTYFICDPEERSKPHIYYLYILFLLLYENKKCVK